MIRTAARAACVAIVLLALAACDEEPAVVGPPPSSSIVSCLGVPATKCEELVKRTLDGLSLDSFRSIRIACTRPPCTERSGEVTVDVVDANGRQSSTGQAWATLDEVENPKPQPSG